MPIRDPRLGLLLRSLFVPEPGECWMRSDYGAQEHRILIHFAVKAARSGLLSPRAAKAAKEFAARYNANPALDPHQETGDMAGIPRKIAKPVNLMSVYGAGKRKIALNCGWITEAIYKDRSAPLPSNVEEFFNSYHNGVPFVKELLKVTDDLAMARGWVTTLLLRRPHFELWQPKRYEDGYGDPLPLAMARAEWPDVPLKRGDTRKALNRIIQGSAADMTKQAMLNCYREGFGCTITVHDELCFSITRPDQARRINHLMTSATPLEVPVLAETGIGGSWGAAYADCEEKDKSKTMGHRWLTEGTTT